MKVSELAAEMNDRFKQFDERFQQVDNRFAQVDERFAQVDARFAQVDARFAQVDARFAQVDERFAQVDERFAQVDNQFVELRQQIAAEGEKTRRHFDIAVEQMKAERNLALDVTKASDERLERMSASNTVEHAGFEARLRDHENRLTKLEEHS